MFVGPVRMIPRAPLWLSSLDGACLEFNGALCKVGFPGHLGRIADSNILAKTRNYE